MKYQALLQQASEALSSVAGSPITVARHTDEKGKSSCPACGGEDRFITWVYELNGTCTRCKKHVRWGEVPHQEVQQRKEEKQRQAHLLRQEMESCEDWITYAEHPHAVELWKRQHITKQTIIKHGLGYNPKFRVKRGEDDFISVETLTIPNYYKKRLVDIRHKLLVPPEDAKVLGKYRSHRPNLKPFPFMADNICTSEPVVIVEGEKKPIIINQEQVGSDRPIKVAGIPGVTTYHDVFTILANKPPNVRNNIYWMLDPGVKDKTVRWLANKTAKMGFPTYISYAYDKPDDMVLEFGIDMFFSAVDQAIRIYV